MKPSGCYPVGPVFPSEEIKTQTSPEGPPRGDTEGHSCLHSADRGSKGTSPAHSLTSRTGRKRWGPWTPRAVGLWEGGSGFSGHLPSPAAPASAPPGGGQGCLGLVSRTAGALRLDPARLGFLTNASPPPQSGPDWLPLANPSTTPHGLRQTLAHLAVVSPSGRSEGSTAGNLQPAHPNAPPTSEKSWTHPFSESRPSVPPTQGFSAPSTHAGAAPLCVGAVLPAASTHRMLTAPFPPRVTTKNVSKPWHASPGRPPARWKPVL